MAEKLKFEDLQSPIVAKRKGKDDFHLVGVIGLGVMGQDIAETIAGAGIEVIVSEKNEKTLKGELDGLNDLFQVRGVPTPPYEDEQLVQG